MYMLAHIALNGLNASVFAGIFQLNTTEVGALTSCMLCPLVVYLYQKSTKRKRNHKGRVQAFNMGLQTVGISLCLAVFTAFLTITFAQYEKDNTSLISLLGIVVAGPITEEIIYRGFVFRKANERWGTTAAIAVSTVLFGIAHAGIVQIIAAMLAGFVFCLVLYNGENIVWAVLAHMGTNLLLCWEPLYRLSPVSYLVGCVGFVLFIKTFIRKFRIELEGE